MFDHDFRGAEVSDLVRKAAEELRSIATSIPIIRGEKKMTMTPTITLRRATASSIPAARPSSAR